ncbi:AAA family ATPase [Streptacidiphilus cavernicola]|uniref:AAA family ATPase n=1 Tax=Streptacidiphilus cavernicola TaxID=3342716 RepID=A0ABV6VY11_9ACTN
MSSPPLLSSHPSGSGSPSGPGAVPGAGAASAPTPPPLRRATVSELRLVAFKSHVGGVLPLAPVTLLEGVSGAGKSNVLDGLAALSGLAGGAELAEALAPIRGGLVGCVPHGRPGFRLGCTVQTPQGGAVRLEVAVRTDGGPRIVAERITETRPGEPLRVLLSTAEEDRARHRVNATWHSDGRQGDIRAPLSADSLLAAQLPLRIAGATAGERRVLAAVEALLTALREVFPIDPVPALMRGWVPAADDAGLRSSAENLSAVLARIQGECRIRYGRLVQTVRAASPVPVRELGVLRGRGADGVERVVAALWEEQGGCTPAGLMGSGLLRRIAFATVLLTGPGVLQMESAEVPEAERLLTVLADGLDPDLLALAAEVAERGHVRVLATARDGGGGGVAAGAGVGVLPAGVRVVGCRRDPATGYSVLEPGAGPGERDGTMGA